MDEREARAALNMVEHVGPVKLRALLAQFGDAPSILRASRDQLQRVAGIGEDTAEAIANWEKTIDLSGELHRAAEFGCQLIIENDPEYPALLREIHDPPIVLYVRGSLRAEDRHSFAIVGSRLTTAYGVDTARRFGHQLGYAGLTVVSGGARGIDTAAHLGALSAKARTVAVLGTGINLVFPPENKELFERIAASGAIVTQFPFGRPADKQSFPIRNRIVAGMTLGTIVVEANLTSGALITANFANEYGRQVFAVPGRVDSPRSRGTHDLIKRGAKLCEGLDDILSEFEYLFPQKALETPGAANAAGAFSQLTEAEARAFAAVPAAAEPSVDEIIRDSGMTASATSVALFSLEMKRLVRQLPGRRYVRVEASPG